MTPGPGVDNLVRNSSNREIIGNAEENPQNALMEFIGKVHHGVVVLDRDIELPEGMAVVVSPRESSVELATEPMRLPPAGATPYPQWALQLQHLLEKATQLSSGLPDGYVVDDSRQSIYEGPGE